MPCGWNKLLIHVLILGFVAGVFNIEVHAKSWPLAHGMNDARPWFLYSFACSTLMINKCAREPRALFSRCWSQIASLLMISCFKLWMQMWLGEFKLRPYWANWKSCLHSQYGHVILCFIRGKNEGKPNSKKARVPTSNVLRFRYEAVSVPDENSKRSLFNGFCPCRLTILYIVSPDDIWQMNLSCFVCRNVEALYLIEHVTGSKACMLMEYEVKHCAAMRSMPEIAYTNGCVNRFFPCSSRLHSLSSEYLLPLSSPPSLYCICEDVHVCRCTNHLALDVQNSCTCTCTHVLRSNSHTSWGPNCTHEKR